MRVVFSSCKNPHFVTITEYIENALTQVCQPVFFDNRAFLIPGGIRDRVPLLERIDLLRMNKKLISIVDKLKPDVFLETGGHRIFPETIRAIKRRGAKTVLWTIDSPKSFDELLFVSASEYDFIFTGGSEGYKLLKGRDVKNLHFLPFACDSAIHRQVKLTDKEMPLYSADIAFVGTMNPSEYPYRVKVLESLSDFNLAVWGPGSELLPQASPLKPLVRGGETPPEVWAKIYSAAKIVLCVHYRGFHDKLPCYQASPRVYEALACGAFLVVDAQPDVVSLFKDRRELVVFKDIDDLRSIIKYYLQHTKERAKITQAGHEEVLAKHTYVHRVREMFNVINKRSGNG